ncbi:MAG: hypothetical protein NNA21_09735 [Nitrospira sp.]|nr:hypothetical protein [Nitrospira sp.]MCP9462330.1 hypothetical protein [Nitrospira sp.]MCP9474618.1 hypothetical protein [Nitrospira sp.]
MNFLPAVNDVWIWVTRDVPLLDGFQIPLASCIGAVGIIVLFLWHGGRFFQGTRRLRMATERIEPQLVLLAQRRRQAAPEWVVFSDAAKKRANRAKDPKDPMEQRDLDDLMALDRIMSGEPTYARDWLVFRRSLVIEQPSWFLEPTVYADKSAAECFSFEAACASHVNHQFYRHFPSFLTGIGLLFTFLAILIGLGKLHANGTQIEGLPGFINGLAGKFVTSIIGLACANVFLLLEKSGWHGLADRHRRIVALLDEMFPQKVRDHGALARASASTGGGECENVSADRTALQGIKAVHQRMDEAVEVLHEISKSLALLRKEDLLVQRERLASTIGGEVRDALARIADPVCVAVDELRRSLGSLRPPDALSAHDVNRLIEQLGDRQRRKTAPSATSEVQKAGWRLSRLWP